MYRYMHTCVHMYMYMWMHMCVHAHVHVHVGYLVFLQHAVTVQYTLLEGQPLAV